LILTTSIVLGIALAATLFGDDKVPPLFEVTLPDSKHDVSGIRLRRIDVVFTSSHGMVPATTYSAWSNWLVIRVMERADSSTPRYYFLNQETQRTVGPWSPGEKVYLERFDPDGRFVAFARSSFLPFRSTTQCIYHYDPATATSQKTMRSEDTYWQEQISLDGTTLASARGGNDTPLEIVVSEISDDSHRRTLAFTQRDKMSSNHATRENYGRQWALSADGSLIALSNDWVRENGNETPNIEIWDTKSGELVQRIGESLEAESIKSVAFSLDGKDLIVGVSIDGKEPRARRFDLTEKTWTDGFNPWEGISWTGFQSRGFNTKSAGMDGKHVVWIRHPMPKDRLGFLEWEIRVTDIHGDELRDWRTLPREVAGLFNERLNVQVVPDSKGVVIMNPDAARITWYDWETDEMKFLATTNKKHNQVDFFGVQPGRVSVLYREPNTDITVRVWSTPPRLSK